MRVQLCLSLLAAIFSSSCSTATKTTAPVAREPATNAVYATKLTSENQYEFMTFKSTLHFNSFIKFH
ncbi:MAG TPA: hypothetical protein VFV50_14820, partial [Bdellovibrionales bacterium]|nr:hypothetical protein [Bdellovibrionales bacterium]